MDGNNKDGTGLPPRPGRSWVAPSTLLLLPSSSQLGGQNQQAIHNEGENILFAEGSSRSINPQYESQQNQDYPISACGGPDVSPGSKTVAVPDARGPPPDPNLEARRLRRLLSNRISAQRSRLKKIDHIREMETQVKEFEAQIGKLAPELMLTRRQKNMLQIDNEMMKQKVKKLQECVNLNNAETESHQAEIYNLKQLLELQQQQNQGWMAGWAFGQEDCTANQGMYQGHLSPNVYQPWAQQQFATPNMCQPSEAQHMEKFGIPMTEPDQMVTSEPYQPEEEMGDPGKYQPGGLE